MELNFAWMVAIIVVVISMVLKGLLEKVNSWKFESKLGEKKNKLPPGNLGLPFIGNMLSFLRAFKSSNPDAFINSYYSRYGNTGIYKSHMFGSPSIIVTTAEGCRKVLTDDEYFKPGWPVSTNELIGKKSFTSIPDDEHKRLRRLTAAPINGHEALSNYIEYIADISVKSLDKWSKTGEIEFLTQLRKMTFRIIMYIFLSSESEPVMEALEKDIEEPFFCQARKKLVAVLQSAIDERKAVKKTRVAMKVKRDMLDALLEVEEDGKKLTDEEIIDLLVMYLNAGHESSGHTIMWATILLQEHPEFLKKAKAEQEWIMKNRPAGQTGLTLREVRQMTYLSQVVDETLRWVSFSFMVFREAKKDFNLNGYLIPKGWKVLTWFRHVHLNPEVWPEPLRFNPDRWDDLVPKAGTFLPFGAGTRLCPGNDLAKLEISIFLHYFLLGYKVQRKNPDCPVQHLPHRRPFDNCVARITKN
ncbi:hypothetical protein KSS87_006193 [Heliosperma pusillum]|nr:hypothetical protein KSS87_006193 [Heliosperma pusillum]